MTPYIEAFYLSYSGLTYVKKFRRKVRKDEGSNPETKITDGNGRDVSRTDNKRLQQSKDDNTKSRSYVLNKSKIRKKIVAYSHTKPAKKALYFYTVSFPLSLSDELAYKYFNIFLTRCRKSAGLESYLWVAERQQNSTLHFHFLTTNFMMVQKINGYMRASLLHGVEKKEFEYDIEKIQKYNGVDISKNRITRKVTNFAVGKGSKILSKYITKYITKNNTQMSRLPYHSSRDISQLRYSFEIDIFDAYYYERFTRFFKNDTGIFRGDFHTVLYWDFSCCNEVFEVLSQANEKGYIYEEKQEIEEKQPERRQLERLRQLSLF